MINEIGTACPFYKGQELLMVQEGYRKKIFNPIIDRISERVDPNSSKCLDIEDLMVQGRINSVCPYYLGKARLAGSDIVILPYSFILN
jgi:hypothetical protein